MRFAVLLRSCLSCALLLSAATLPKYLQSQPAPTPASDQVSTLAHRLLAEGVSLNALEGDDVKPWHVKISYQLQVFPGVKPVRGEVEEWHVSRYRWRRDFTGSFPGTNGTEWSLSKLERYETTKEKYELGRRLITLRIARPVIDPLYQASNIHPDYPMDIAVADAGSLTLNCISVIDPQRYAEDTNPDWLFPMMCFDKEGHLRATHAGDTSVQFDDLQPFQGRTVARDVKVIVNGTVNAEMKVTLLEPWDASNQDLLKPGKDAGREPYKLEPGEPKPEPIQQAAAHFPSAAPSWFPGRELLAALVVIHKDGKVTVIRKEAPSVAMMDSIEIAAKQWRFKPYLVDGQPVELEYTILFQQNGKPFVPASPQAKPTPN